MAYSKTYELSIAEASELIKEKKLSPVDLLEDHIERIEAKDHHLNAFITNTFERAKDKARICEQDIIDGNWKGPLHGIPVAVKDLFYTKDVVTTMGSQTYKSFIPTFNATVVDKLESAGAILIGKLNMHEFAFGTTGKNSVYGDCTNPWNTMKITGGSSSGSASAVAGGLCMGALGTDTGGSIRIPAGLCGIVGLKPTFGRVSRKGVFPLSNSLDTVGPMTRTVKDAQILLSAISGRDHEDKHNSQHSNNDLQLISKLDLKNVKIAVPTDYFFDFISDDVNNAIAETMKVFQGLGATVNQVSLPVLDHSLGISGTILMAEAANIHKQNLKDNPHQIGPDVRIRLQQGAMILATDYLEAQRARQKFNFKVRSLLDEYDVILSPTVGVTAPDFSQETISIGEKSQAVGALMARLTRPQNITGLPTISIPCGFDKQHMPIGFQLTAPGFQESTLTQIGSAYETAAGWFHHKPEI